VSPAIVVEAKVDQIHFPARRSNFGGASQTNCPFGGETRFNSINATPAFFRDVM
jgi:hypothetical protein